MSKSIGNVIDPTYFVDKYGADAVRFCVNIIAPIGNDFELNADTFNHLYNHYLVNT
jgi:valyl-tRNA synthetase